MESFLLTRKSTQLVARITLTLLILAPSLSISTAKYNDEKQPLNVPTFLSVRETATGRLRYAPKNAFYENILRRSRFLDQSFPSNTHEEDEPNQNKYLNNSSDEEIREKKGVREGRRKRRVLYDNTVALNAATHCNALLKLDKAEISHHRSLRLSVLDDAECIDGGDMVALYCPAGEPNHKKFKDANTIRHIRYDSRMSALSREYQEHYDNDDDNDITRRTGGVDGGLDWFIPSFPIVRESTCEFRYWKRDFIADSQVFTLLFRSETIVIKDAEVIPTGLHLSLTNSSSEMRVHFTTGVEGTPVVAYHAATDEEGEKETLVYGISTTYYASDMCQAPANVEEPGKFTPPGQLHTVLLSNLTPNTSYHYRVGVMTEQSTSDGIVWSPSYTFIPTSRTSTPHSFILYSDQGIFPKRGWNVGRSVFEKVARREANATSVHHIGDLSYADGAGHVWDEWLYMVEPLVATRPLMVGLGNHEYDHTKGGTEHDPSGVTTAAGLYRNNASNGECGVPYAKRFSGSGNGHGPFWYSYDRGGVHTVVISSQHDFRPHTPQYYWFKRDMKAVNRDLTPWIIVESHAPFYNTIDGNKDDMNGMEMRKSMEHLLKRFKVDLLVSGHNHIYLRTCKGLYDGVCNAGGTLHIIIGTGGVVDKPSPLHEQKYTKKKWKEVLLRESGYGRVTVVNETAMHWEFVSFDNDEVFDDVWINR